MNYDDDCVLCGRQRELKSDFCADCIASESVNVNDEFGRCYVCRDFKDHQDCIGVPCQCPCPLPETQLRLAEQEAALSKLTPRERAILGF